MLKATDQDAYSADQLMTDSVLRHAVFVCGGHMPKIILLGDSTCSPRMPESRPETGWGEILPEFVREGWTVSNHAVGGLATKDAISRGLFQAALDEVSSGDVVLIQFGHNDSKKEDPSRFSDPWSGYVVNLVYMAEKVRKKGAFPVILTSIARRRFENGLVADTHGDYPAAAKAAAHQAGCPAVDMSVPTMIFLQREGEEASRGYFMNFPAGLYPGFPDGSVDNTHLTEKGARWISSLVRDLLKDIPGLPDCFI